MPFDLSGKSAVVTGAGSGIGLAIASALSQAGAKVHMLDLSAKAATAAADELNTKRPKQPCAAHTCDVSDEQAVKSTFDAICSGARMDILVCNAGISAVGTVVQATVADMDKVYKVNVLGVFYCLKYGVQHMIADGKGGAIVNLASIASLIGLTDRFAYSMSKGAVLTMSRSVAIDYVKHGIRCNAICPGRVHTPFVDGYLAKNYPGREKEVFDRLSAWHPLGRMGQPEEVAALVLYLCSDEAGFVTGVAYPIDGGRSSL